LLQVAITRYSGDTKATDVKNSVKISDPDPL